MYLCCGKYFIAIRCYEPVFSDLVFDNLLIDAREPGYSQTYMLGLGKSHCDVWN
jgi:hypothetical protein